MRLDRRWLGALLLGLATSALAGEEPKPVTAALQLLETHCIECHGGRTTRGGLDLTTRAGLLNGGASGASVVPGQAKASHLYLRLTHAETPGMPYRRDRLAEAEVARVAAWIDAGSPYDRALAGAKQVGPAEWWAFQPLAKKVPPAVGDRFPGWPHTPLDTFVLAKLLDKGLAPAPEADRRTWLRRVTFDLTGLPPTPAEIEAFLADPSPDAYERVADRLLASPRYGERWARHWMDVVHFGETHGHDQDRPRPNAWPYRDYLIRAFNDDRPYTRFVQEQVAGDVLWPRDPQAIVALGLLGAGPWDESSLRDIQENTVDRQVARYLDRDDMLTTVMATFVSLTVHCARCHDHKFDPIPQKDYYALQAVFAGVDKAERAYDADPAVADRRKALLAQQAELQARHSRPAADWLTPSVEDEVAAWELTVSAAARQWLPLEPAEATSAAGTTLVKQPDFSLLATGTRPETDTYTVTAHTDLMGITGVRLEVLADEKLPHKGPGRQDNGNLHLSEFQLKAAPRGASSATQVVALQNPRADFDQQGWTIAMALDGNPATAWGIYPQVGQTHRAVFDLKEPLGFQGGTTLTFVLDQKHGRAHLIGRPRFSVTTAPLPLSASADTLPPAVAAALAVPAGQRNAAQKAELALHVLEKQVERQLAALPPRQMVYAGTSDFTPDGSFRPAKTPRPIHVLRRGDVNQPGAVALPGALACVPGLEAQFRLSDLNAEGQRRVALARWLTDSRNVLTWRSIVNRVWHYHFGRGLVETPNDFGRMGAQPTHPELLDWLTLTFLEEDGSLKKLHRRIVTSAVYRQSSRHEPRWAAIDGDNRLLWRMNRTRLDAECVRDAVLQASGKLDLTMGGPSVKQFIQKPGIHVTPLVDYAGFDPDRPENHRRSVYRFVFRTLPDPFMETLDCADASQLTPVRNTSVTALQALTMLNNAFIIRQSEHLATRAARSGPDLPTQLRAVYQLTLGRTPTPRELQALTEYASRHGLANACRVVLNSNEFLFVN